MAKTRAQRKAERRAREQQSQQQRQEESRAQHDTQVPKTAEVAEAEIVEQAAGAVEPPAPAPSRADKPPAARTNPPKPKPKAKPAKPAPAQRERRRGAVLSFFASSWAELKRVQWPDRETLVQASAVTIVFVAVAAAYLGALDAAFSFVVKRVL